MQLHVDAQLVRKLAIQLDAATREVVIAARRPRKRIHPGKGVVRGLAAGLFALE
jgi:hypothetical protein